MGLQGEEGEPGVNGTKGQKGTDGVPGSTGKITHHTYVSQGVNLWSLYSQKVKVITALSFSGRPGKSGRPGTSGQRGLPGKMGRQGIVGEPGNAGEDGIPGRRGFPGKTVSQLAKDECYPISLPGGDFLPGGGSLPGGGCLTEHPMCKTTGPQGGLSEERDEPHSYVLPR